MTCSTIHFHSFDGDNITLVCNARLYSEYNLEQAIDAIMMKTIMSKRHPNARIFLSSYFHNRGSNDCPHLQEGTHSMDLWHRQARPVLTLGRERAMMFPAWYPNRRSTLADQSCPRQCYSVSILLPLSK